MKLPVSLVKIFVCLFLLWPLSGLAVEVSSKEHLNVFEHLQICRTQQTFSIEEISSGHCKFRELLKEDISPGFSSDTFWLQLKLSNSSHHTVERWLSIGHPRLQFVSFYWQTQTGSWQMITSGQSVPLAQRPLATLQPTVNLFLDSDQTRTVFVKIVSASTLQLNTELWDPKAFVQNQYQKLLYQVLILGGLSVAVGFALIMFFNTRDKTYALFSSCLVFVIFQDASYTGLIQLYLWPEKMAFPLQLQVVLIGSSLFLFKLFVRHFLNIHTNDSWINKVSLGSMLGLLLTTFWACFFSVGTAVQIMPLFLMSSVLSSMGLYYQAYRQKELALDWYLVISYSTLAAILLYRATLVFGMGSNPLLQSLGSAWSFLLITPHILSSTIKRTKALDKALMLSQLETNARIKFMAQMSHEFRSPLNTILGYAELQERGILSISQENCARQIKYSGRHLLNMIDEILDHVRGNAGLLKLELTEVNWLDFVHTLQQNTVMQLSHGNQFLYSQKGHAPTLIIADQHHLLHALNNLLINANHYTKNGIITLHCEISPLCQQRYTFTFSITDTGAGIAESELTTIFQPFVRGDAGNNSGIDGSGLGLSIVQHYVKLMGSEIKVKSSLGNGSTFSFSIECDTTDNLTRQTSSNLEPLSRQYNILLVDDDKQNLEILSLLLTDAGFTVSTAESSKAAKRFWGTNIDLVITDQRMGKENDGWRVLEEWSALDVPVILLSAIPPDRPEIFDDALQFRYSLMKPYDANTLFAMIRNVLNIRHQSKFETSSPTAPEIDKPPAELLAPLEQMLNEGAISDIIDYLNQVYGLFPEYEQFWKTLRNASLNFDFSSIRKLICAPNTR